MLPTQPIAVIIPSLTGEVGPLLAALRKQTRQPDEVAVVRGVRPNGRARNQGVARTSAPLLMFIDDDALPGADDLIARLVATLDDPTVAVAGASKLLPPDAPWFQRWAAREVARIVHPVVAAPLETNPDPPAFYCEVTTTCCAMRRELFERAGGFDDTLVRGVDTEFFVRVRRLTGMRFILAAQTWTYHPAPATLRALLRKQFLYGFGHAQEVRRDPARARGRDLRTPLHAAAFLLFRTAILLPNVFLPYSYAAPSWRPGFKPLKALASYASALGYLWGWYHDDANRA
jgi:cellulose synthase/poly-beta-1,6-N-acetylglucosamine synthase-like glycosyltransferase